LYFRTGFDEFLLRFFAGNPDLFGGLFAETILAAVEFDMLTRPHVYHNTLLSSASRLRRLKVLEKRQRGWPIECPDDIPREAALLQEGKPTAPLMEPTVIATDHERGQMYRMVRRTEKEYWDECRLFVLEMAIRPGGTCPSRTSPSRLPRVSTQLEGRMSRG
jgi:hypothetical protein